MARKKKTDTTAQTPAQVAPENTAPLQEGEAHLDPAQFEDMDDATLQGLARDMGLDPAAYDSRDALIAAIAAVPVIPGPPEADPEPEPEPEAPAQEPPADTAPAQEAEQPPEAGPEETPAPVPPQERPLPYKATVGVALAVVRKAVGLGTADQLKPVGTLKQGAAVTVIDRFNGYAQLANGLWIDEAFLSVTPRQ